MLDSLRKSLPLARACAAGLLVLAGAGTAGAAGFRGVVLERLPGGGFGDPIAGVTLKFLKEDHSHTAEVTSGATGRYQVELPTGRYLVTATSLAFEDYSSAP